MTNYPEMIYQDQTITKYLYTLKDLASLDNDDYANSLTLYDIRSVILGWDAIGEDINTLLNSPYVTKLWSRYILPRYFDEVISISDIKLKDLSDTELNKKVYGHFYRIFESLLISSYERYSKLLELYEREESNLMNQLTTSSVSKGRTNEIPQSTPVDPYDTKFTNNSSVAEVETKVDSASIPAKLREIRSMWISVYEEWADEFKDLFIEEREE